MNELDLFVVARDTSDSASLHVMNFVAGLFAFILASHFVGAKLSRLNLAILLGIFSFFSLLSALAAIARLQMTRTVVEQMSRAPESSLSVPNLVVAPYAPVAVSILFVVAYLGGIMFLVETRRTNSPAA